MSLSEDNRHILLVIGHLTPVFVLRAIKIEEAPAIARNVVERVFSVLGPPKSLNSDQGLELDNQFFKRVAERLRIL